MNVGFGTYGQSNIARRGVMNNINIGKYCSIATNVVADGGFNHNTNFVSTYPFYNIHGLGVQNIVCKGDINIGNDVWICENVLIMSGVTIGNGAVIGANSIITKDVEPYSVYVGSPAKCIKMRFDTNDIKELELIKWWDWDEEKIKEELPNAIDINEFINKHKVCKYL